ncbi:hypothetical protein ACEQ8H_007824 [Pleosporales sp. CAS-2024a]
MSRIRASRDRLRIAWMLSRTMSVEQQPKLSNGRQDSGGRKLRVIVRSSEELELDWAASSAVSRNHDSVTSPVSVTSYSSPRILSPSEPASWNGKTCDDQIKNLTLVKVRDGDAADGICMLPNDARSSTEWVVESADGVSTASATYTVAKKSAPVLCQSSHKSKQTMDSLYRPFERPSLRRPDESIELSVSSIHESNCKAGTLSGFQHSADTLAESERERKIEQIKARPSRKTYFGSGQRLAHKRRHELEDIHDERDGAWMPAMRYAGAGSCSLHQNSSQTLKELFHLPNNMMPVNDGPMELAFKDVTRNKRSRAIHRVGKMFGGELTIRTS